MNVCAAGCSFSSRASFGKLYTPGFLGHINYPNFVTCTWTLDVSEPISLLFDPDTDLTDEDHTRQRNADYLKVGISGKPRTRFKLT